MNKKSQYWTFLASLLVLSLVLSACAGQSRQTPSRSAPPCA